MFVRRNVARFGGSRPVVGPCNACSLRSGVALALEILFFAPLSIVMKQEPLKTCHARKLKPSTFTRMAKQHRHENLSQLSCYFCVTPQILHLVLTGEPKAEEGDSQDGQLAGQCHACDKYHAHMPLTDTRCVGKWLLAH